MIENIILIIIAIVLSIIGMANLFINKDKHVMEGLDFTFIFLYYIDEIIYFFFFNLSFDSIFTIETVNIFYNISIVLRVIKLALLGSIHSYVLIESKIKYLPAFIYSFLSGVIGIQIFLFNAFEITLIQSSYVFRLRDYLLFSLIISFNAIMLIFPAFIQRICSKNIGSKKKRSLFNLCIIYYLIDVFVYIIYFFHPIVNLRYLHSLFFLSFLVFIDIVSLRNFDLFIILTNKIYDFSVFHRSGVLLFSYNFERGEEIEDSMLKGSILIGINHILSNFIDKKDKLNLIKMKDRDIIFDYNDKFGFGILIIAKNKNKTLSKAVKLFMESFLDEYQEILKKINEQSRIIDISQFNMTKNLVKAYFNPFIP